MKCRMEILLFSRKDIAYSWLRHSTYTRTELRTKVVTIRTIITKFFRIVSSVSLYLQAIIYLTTLLSTAIYCPDPIIPDNGRLLSESSIKHGKYPVGDLMIYTCKDGYEVVGESSIVCTENGFWSHPPPFCLPPSEIRKADTIFVENTTLIHIEE